MKAKELNALLIEALPELEDAYHEQVDWQEGDETGSHVVYGDVLVPVMLKFIKANQFNMLKKYFDFLEAALEMNDPYVTDVIATSVIESIFFDEIDHREIKKRLGKEALKVWEAFQV